MIVFSLKEDGREIKEIPDSSFFLKGDKNLCFLIHGLTGTAKEMGSIGVRLNREGFSVASPMMLGHNQSLSVLKRVRWQELYAGIKKEFLKYESEYKNIFVGGLSFGALIAILLAYEFPKKVRAINCFSPTLFFDGWNTPKAKILLPLVFNTPLKYYVYLKEEYPYGIKNERLRSKVESFYKASGLFDYSKVHLYGYPVIPVSSMHQNRLLAKYIGKVLPLINTPIQILQAKEDDITSPKNSYFIYDHIGSKDKKVILLEDSYHIIIADQEREKVAQETISFFKGYR
ncbi:MAG: Carboxylesterase [Candidatus Omnitrophica bacterium ADurb.Bin205]|nr:MAG: Carboxylesterase [Candidatus Omnitrophica bacterium ADurb.Bin205]